MRLLFICSRNQWRSPTAEAIYKNHPEHKARSAGVSPEARIKVSEKMILWADIIFCMEKRHRQRLEERFPQAMIDVLETKQEVVLDIPDDYLFMDPELVEILNQAIPPFLNQALI